jgi:hypothetical protein
MSVRHLPGRLQKSEIRSQKTALSFCFLISVFYLLPQGIAEPSPPARVDIVARIYNTAGMSPAMTADALGMATRVMIAGAIDVAWKNCDLPGVCATVPVREFVIRLVRLPQTTGGSAARDQGPGKTYEGPFVLGEASIDLTEQTGVLATIYVNRVERMAALSEADTASLLGRAIAHELGHLLLATNAHSARGLMRAQWTAGELRRNQSEDWMLTRKDAEAIRRRLTIATKTTTRSKNTKRDQLAGLSS